MTYTIGRQDNAYFEGFDATLYREADNARVATIGMREHRPAVAVKHDLFLLYANIRDDLDVLTDAEIEAEEEGAMEAFWRFTAPDLAREHGFHDVYQAGRSGGWLLPDPAPDLSKSDPEDTPLMQQRAKNERERFFAFAEDVTAAVEGAEQDVIERLSERAEEVRRARRNNELALAGWRY